jgi:hypothetical protein
VRRRADLTRYGRTIGFRLNRELDAWFRAHAASQGFDADLYAAQIVLERIRALGGPSGRPEGPKTPEPAPSRPAFDRLRALPSPQTGPGQAKHTKSAVFRPKR